jgi:hypothetical protein
MWGRPLVGFIRELREICGILATPLDYSRGSVSARSCRSQPSRNNFYRVSSHTLGTLRPSGGSFPQGDFAFLWASLVRVARYPSKCDNFGLDCRVRLIGQLRNHFDYVILDTPPVGLIADSDLIHQVSDGVILVVRSDFTTRYRCLNILTSMSARGLLGVVLNGVPKRYMGQSNGYYGYSRPAGF